MFFLKVKIEEFSSHDYPGFVLCTFTDIYGKRWVIEEKVPVIFSKMISEKDLPIEGFYIAGEIIKQENKIIYFDTKKPWGISATSGETIFKVSTNQISEIATK